MKRLNDKLPNADLTFEKQEADMRRSLGVSTSQNSVAQISTPNRTRNRFKRDGDVVVEYIGARNAATFPADRVELARRNLQEEQDTRQKAERALAEVQDKLRALQTQIAHTELAHSEALAEERKAREGAEAALREYLSRQSVLSECVKKTPSAISRPRQTARKLSNGKGVKPVEWWVPGWRERGEGS